jgi:hypothetical protein
LMYTQVLLGWVAGVNGGHPQLGNRHWSGANSCHGALPRWSNRCCGMERITTQCPPRPAHHTPAPHVVAHVYELCMCGYWCCGFPMPWAGREASFSVWSGLVGWVAWAVGSVRPAHRRTLGSAGDLRVLVAERSMCRHGDQCTCHAVCGGVVVCEQLATPALWLRFMFLPCPGKSLLVVVFACQPRHTGAPALQCTSVWNACHLTSPVFEVDVRVWWCWFVDG